MITEYTFTSPRLAPTPGELDEGHDDYINPGLFAAELSAVVIAGLAEEGYRVRARVVEDWGNWIEIDHDGGFPLAVCCANIDGSAGSHRVATVPDRPHVRKFLRKIDVQADVERLSAALFRILSRTEGITDLRAGP